MSLKLSQFLHMKCVPDNLSRHSFLFPLPSLLCFTLKDIGKSCLRTPMGDPRTLELKWDLANMPYLFTNEEIQEPGLGTDVCRAWVLVRQSWVSQVLGFPSLTPLLFSALPSDRTCSLESLYRRVSSKEGTLALSQLQIRVSRWQRHLLPCVFSIRCNGCHSSLQPRGLKKFILSHWKDQKYKIKLLLGSCSLWNLWRKIFLASSTFWWF